MRLWCFNNSSFHGKWNEEVLLINLVYTSCLKSFFYFLFFVFFVCTVLFTDTDHSECSRGPSVIPFYHFHSLTNNDTLFATFHVRWLSRIFNRNAFVCQTATHEIYHLIELRFEWLTDDECLFVCLMNWY